MADRYLLDTDILIEYLRGAERAIQYLEGLDGELLMSAITVAELWSGVRGELEAEALERFTLAFRVVPVDEEIARRGGLIRQQYRASHETGLADALIAASALREEASLVSFNSRHYPMISDLDVPYDQPS